MNGIEWIVEAHGCAPETLSDLRELRALFERIIRDLKLQPVGKTCWHQFPGSGGITGLCLLAESHLACHTFPEYRSLCLNLFCCAPRGEWNFEGSLREMFAANQVTVRQVLRPYMPEVESSQAGLPAAESNFPAGRRVG
jgi:S-adenosylmethionine decarboxylase